MTDEQIIKALECCINGNCDDCYNVLFNCMHNAITNALDLINRQKAEKERLLQKLQQAESEAIYKLVKKFKDRIVNKYEYVQVGIFDELDNLVKEITEEI